MDQSSYPHGGMAPEVDYANAGPYKERFHATRERYAHATQMQEDYRRELDACLAKERVLQEEVNLLIDVLGVTLSDHPIIREYMAGTPSAPARPLSQATSRYTGPIPKTEERAAPNLSQPDPLPQSTHDKEVLNQPEQEDDPMEG